MNQCERFKEILKENNLKQKQFAKDIGVTESYVSKLLKNPEINISQSLANLIEERYGYNSEWVQNGISPKSKHNNPEMLIKMKTYNHFGYIMENSSPQKRAVLTALIEMVGCVPDDKWDYIINTFNCAYQESLKKTEK